MRRTTLVTLAVIAVALARFPFIGMAAAPASIAVWNGAPQSTAVGASFQVALVAVVRDAANNGVAGVTVTFTAPAGGASAAFSGSQSATALTNASGAAVAPTLTANGIGGSYSVTATVAGVAGSAAFSLTNTGGTSGGSAPGAPAGLRFFVVAGPPSSVTPSAGTPQTTTVNTGFATLQALVKDASANPISGVSVTFASPTTGASALFGGTTSSTVTTNSSGIATAAALTANGTVGTYVVTASVAGVAMPASFSMTNVAVPTGGGTGVWTNVTPAGISLAPSGTAGGTNGNYGVYGAHADSSHPGTLYAPANYQGLWKSTDYGLTWAKVVTSGLSPLDNGRGSMRIAADGSYIITTALYPIGGYSNGAWKSSDGGRTWTRYNVGANNADDIGEFEISPFDKNRVLASPHSPPYDMFESRDGGQTWTNQGAAGNTNSAGYFWIDDNTVLAISDGDQDASGPGTWRGVRSGSTWPWRWTWTRVSNQQHWHGSSQQFLDPNTGAIFSGGAFGIQKSTDAGLTWTTVASGYSAGIVATPSMLYSTANYASQGGFGPWWRHASRPGGGTNWIADNPPAALNNGWVRASVVYDGTHYVIVTGNRNAGLWRYVE